MTDSIKPGDVTDIDRERAKFEAAACKLFNQYMGIFERDDAGAGTYVDRTLESAWDVWLAARSESAAEIERLRARVAELEDTQGKLAGNLWGHAAGAMMVEKKLKARADRLQSELDAANAKVAALEKIPSGALDALEQGQRQLDMDGVMVGVSRQAVDEVVTGVRAALTTHANELEGK